MPTYAFDLEVPLISNVTGTGRFPLDFIAPEMTSLEFLDPKTFEGEALAVAAIAGTIAIVALVAGGAYVVFQISQATNMFAGAVSGGLEASKSVAGGFSSIAQGAGKALGDVSSSIKKMLPF